MAVDLIGTLAQYSLVLLYLCTAFVVGLHSSTAVGTTMVGGESVSMPIQRQYRAAPTYKCMGRRACSGGGVVYICRGFRPYTAPR